MYHDSIREIHIDTLNNLCVGGNVSLGLKSTWIIYGLQKEKFWLKWPLCYKLYIIWQSLCNLEKVMVISNPFLNKHWLKKFNLLKTKKIITSGSKCDTFKLQLPYKILKSWKHIGKYSFISLLVLTAYNNWTKYRFYKFY